MITDAVRHAKLSGEYFSNNSFAIASDPEPDTGRKTSNGVISFGTPSLSSTGDINEHMISTAPEDVNIPIPIRSKMKDGKRDTAVFKPFCAPFTKSSYEFLSIKKIIPITESSTGITRYEKSSIKTPEKTF